MFLQIGYTSAKLMFEEVYKLIEKVYSDHKETFDPNQMRDLIDVFIKQIEAAENVRPF